MNLRPYQEEASAFLQRHQHAFVHAPAGSGKTVIGAHAWSRVAYGNCYWLANTQEQVDQAVRALGSFKPAYDVDLTVCCVAAQPDTSNADFVIFDEAHRAPARTWKALADRAPLTARLWGLSATPWGPDAERNKLLLDTFQNFHEVSRAELLSVGALEEGRALIWDLDEEGEFDEQIEANTQAEWLKARGRFAYLKGDMFKAKEQEQLRYIRWRHTQDALRQNERRDDQACELAKMEMRTGQSVLVLVHAIDHGENFAYRIPGSELVYSKIGAKKRRDRITAFKAGELKCLIATSLADEGLDVPIASRLILVAGGRSAGKVEQRAGRVLRPFAGKTGGIIHDFLDRGAALANAQAWARMRTYEALGYQPEVRSVR